MRIREVMNHPVVTCSIEHHLSEIARLMWEHDCGVVPVVDREGRLTGMITDRDICMAAYTQGKTLADIPVDTVMAHAVVFCHANDTVEAAERLMRDARVRRVPVVDDERRPVGIVAMNDLARLAARAHKTAIDREVVQTLAAICEPHAHMDIEEMNHSAGTPMPA